MTGKPELGGMVPIEVKKKSATSQWIKEAWKGKTSQDNINRYFVSLGLTTMGMITMIAGLGREPEPVEEVGWGLMGVGLFSLVAQNITMSRRDSREKVSKRAEKEQLEASLIEKITLLSAGMEEPTSHRQLFSDREYGLMGTDVTNIFLIKYPVNPEDIEISLLISEFHDERNRKPDTEIFISTWKNGTAISSNIHSPIRFKDDLATLQFANKVLDNLARHNLKESPPFKV